MILVKKLAAVISIVFGGSLALAAVALAAGGGGGLDPGFYKFNDKNAMATFGTLKGGPPGQQGFSVIVDRGLNSFRPIGPDSSRTVMKSTVVILDIFDDTGNVTFGCFVVNPADFAVSKDLQAASLHTTLTAAEVCPGAASPVAGGGAPAFGGGGGGTALPLPITLDLTWSGLGVISTGTGHNTTRCLDASTEFSSTYKTSNANATGTISALSGSFQTSIGDVTSSDVTATVKGVPQPACIPQ